MITIDDLEEDQELDAQAMQAIFGGRRAAGSVLGSQFTAQVRFDESRLVPGLIKIVDLREGNSKA